MYNKKRKKIHNRLTIDSHYSQLRMSRAEANAQTDRQRTLQNTNIHIINSPAFGSPSALPCAVFASVCLPTLALLPRGRERKRRGGGGGEEGCRDTERGREGHAVARDGEQKEEESEEKS